MKEFFRSSDVTALLQKNSSWQKITYQAKSYWTERRLRRFQQIPGAVFHLAHDAILAVGDEDETTARDVLAAIDIPEGGGGTHSQPFRANRR